MRLITGIASILISLPFFSIAIIEFALLGIGQDFIGFVDVFETLLGGGIARVDIGMMLAGGFAKRRLERRFVGRPIDAKRFVIILELDLRHRVFPVARQRAKPMSWVAGQPCASVCVLRGHSGLGNYN